MAQQIAHAPEKKKIPGCGAKCPAAVGCIGLAGGVAGQGSGCLVVFGKRSVTAGVVNSIGLPLTRRGPTGSLHPTDTKPADDCELPPGRQSSRRGVRPRESPSVICHEWMGGAYA